MFLLNLCACMGTLAKLSNLQSQNVQDNANMLILVYLLIELHIAYESDVLAF